MLLRIEDIDSPRVKAGADAQAIEDLSWLGLDWDEGPVWQTRRLDLYTSALERLKEQELVYPCTCTRADIERAASAPHLEHEGAPYPGTCAGRSSRDAEGLEGRAYAWRFRYSGTASSFQDLYLGPTAARAEHGGDFVVWKSSGSPAYQLAVVVDDADLAVTEVLRGDDLVPSTPRQLQLYAALGLAAPAFAHLPLVVGADGRRLAKRHGDTRLATLRASGVPAESILGLLAWSLGCIAAPAPCRPSDLVGKLRLDRIPREPLVLTPELLLKVLGTH